MPRFVHVHDLVAPDPPDVCELAAFPVAVVPYALAALEHRIPPYIWADDSYVRGVQLVRSLQMALLCGGMTELIAEVRALRGLDPAYVTTAPEDRTIDMYRSLNDVLQSNLDLRGVLSDGWFTDPQFATIADLVQAQRGSNSAAGKDMWDEIALIIGDASGVSQIADFVVDILGKTEEAVVEGGLLTILVALTASNAAMMQQMLIFNAMNTEKINAILAALRGDTAPDDNILQALRGDVEASATRNVADLLE